MAFWFPFLQLLGVHPSILLEALTHRKIEAKTEEVTMPVGGNGPALPPRAAACLMQEEDGGPGGGQTPAFQLLVVSPASASPSQTVNTKLPCLPFTMPFLHEVFAHAVPSAGTLFPVLLPTPSHPSVPRVISSKSLPDHPTPS